MKTFGQIFSVRWYAVKYICFKSSSIQIGIGTFNVSSFLYKKVNIKRPGRSAIEKAVISIALKFPIDRALDTKKCLDKVDVLLKKYPVEESKWIINFMGQTSFKYTEMIEKSIYGKDTWYAFENIKLLNQKSMINI